MKLKQIRGAGGGGGKGGGGGGGRTPVEAPDSLRSRQYARVLDAVAEGEIVGLVNGMKSVYLDDTPVQNADGSYNFTGVTLATRNGTQDQSYIPGFGAVESEKAVSVPVTAAAPVTRSISNPNANAIRVTISIPQLSNQSMETGDTNGTSVQIAIDVQTDGGGFVQLLVDTISGKTTSQYQRSYRLNLTGTGPWDVRVRRLTPDSTQQALQNSTYWASYTEIIDAKLRYPNTALVALSVDAERFQSIPRRGYEMKGLKVRIPSNYNPITREYTGAWDGTFTIDWTNNPAWCFFDMLTAERYGLGAFVDVDQVDKWALYEIGRYCDELVPDGYGGMEPRFTCNLYLQTREEAFTVINNMASAFRGLAYWSGGTVVATQDAPKDPVKLFTPANVLDSETGPFSYSGSSIKTQHTVALVTWNDPVDRYKQKIEYVEDAEGVAKYGVVQTEVVAIGCTSRGQAHRFGRSILFAERMETEVITFRTGLDGLDVVPGDIIQTSDPVRAGARVGGRLLEATADTLKLDSKVTITVGETFTLWCVLPDGKLQSRTVTSAPDETDVLTVSPAFDAAPQPMAVWTLAAASLVPETWRVVSMTEVDGTQAEISALAYRADKYGAIELDLVLEPLQTSLLDAGQAPPFDLQVSESLYLITPAIVGARLTVSWAGNATYYELQYRRRGDNWRTITSQAPSVDIQPVEAGTYEFVLVGINAIGVRSRPVNLTKEVYGKHAPPADVEDFSITKVSGVAMAAWSLHPDLDVQIGGQIVVRHSPLLEGVTWNDAYVVEYFAGNAVNGLMPLMTGTYFVKARDASGNWSQNAIAFVATEGMVTGFTTVGITVQAPEFTGLKSSTVVTEGGLQLDSALPIDDVLDPVDDWPLIDTLGGIVPEGSYEFDQVLDLGSVATRRVEADILSRSFDTGDFVDAREALIDDWDSFDGDVINDCDLTLYASTTDDDPSDSPHWSAETPFFVSDFTCRAIKFRLALESGQPNHCISVQRLTVRAKVPA